MVTYLGTGGLSEEATSMKDTFACVKVAACVSCMN